MDDSAATFEVSPYANGLVRAQGRDALRPYLLVEEHRLIEHLMPEALEQIFLEFAEKVFGPA